MTARRVGRAPEGGMRYVGGGDYLPGIPARDLTAEEAVEHRAAIEENEAATGKALYVAMTEAVELPAEEA
jgi:hypothetical protein